MSTNVTITYNQISQIQSDLSVLKSKAEKGVAVFQKRGSSTKPKPISDLSFVLMEIPITFVAKDKTLVIKTPTDANAEWVSALQSPYFVAISDVKSDSTDTGTYSTALYTSIKGESLGDNGAIIGEIVRNTAADKKYDVIVDILFISLNP